MTNTEALHSIDDARNEIRGVIDSLDTISDALIAVGNESLCRTLQRLRKKLDVAEKDINNATGAWVGNHMQHVREAGDNMLKAALAAAGVDPSGTIKEVDIVSCFL